MAPAIRNDTAVLGQGVSVRVRVRVRVRVGISGEITAEALFALNQQRPLLSVEKRQPRDHLWRDRSRRWAGGRVGWRCAVAGAAHQVALLQRAQHWSIELPGAEPRPGVCGLMSMPESGAPQVGPPLGPLKPSTATAMYPHI